MNLTNKALVILSLCISSVEAQVKDLPKTSVHFQKTQLLDKYVSEGASISGVFAFIQK